MAWWHNRGAITAKSPVLSDHQRVPSRPRPTDIQPRCLRHPRIPGHLHLWGHVGGAGLFDSEHRRSAERHHAGAQAHPGPAHSLAGRLLCGNLSLARRHWAAWRPAVCSPSASIFSFRNGPPPPAIWPPAGAKALKMAATVGVLPTAGLSNLTNPGSARHRAASGL